MVSQHGTWGDELWTCWVYSSDMAEHQVEHDIEHMEQIMEQSMEHITEDIWKIYGRYGRHGRLHGKGGKGYLDASCDAVRLAACKRIVAEMMSLEAQLRVGPLA